MDISKLTLIEARRLLDAKEFSALELTEAYLKEIQKRDPDIHAYLEVWEDFARTEAQAADKKIASRTQSQLTGIPLAIKDNILIEGRIATAASKILEKYTASYDATVITKLKRQGAIFLGRTNMDEFAMGSSTENSAYGSTKNPHDTTRVPGGSSGGSAAAVAGNMALAGLGSDTGGSVRQPAALCGVVGLKPTYGAVSRFGLIAMGSSLDQIGPITRTVADARIMFEVMAGKDPKDSTGVEFPRKQKRAKSRVVGVPRDFLSGADKDVLEKFDATLSALLRLGYEIRDIKLPMVQNSLAVYYIVMPAEASTNLARFDGIRYGFSVAGEDIGDVYKKTRGQGFGREVRRRILVGTFVLSAGYADAYYRKAIAVRELIRQDFSHVFESGVDVIATPTAPSPAFKFGEKADPLAMYAADIFTVPLNLAGIPALSIPMGRVERGGVSLPVGFQIIGPSQSEETLFAVGEDVERA